MREVSSLVVALVIAQTALGEPPADRGDRIRAALREDAASQAWWFWGWAAGFGTASAVQLGLAGGLGLDSRLAPSAALGGAGASLALIGLAIGPLRPRGDGLDDLDSLELSALEAQLRAQAKREAAATGWLPYVLAVSVATAAGVTLWLHHDQPLEAGIAFGVDLLVGGTQIWTAPTEALELWEQLHPGVDP